MLIFSLYYQTISSKAHQKLTCLIQTKKLKYAILSNLKKYYLHASHLTHPASIKRNLRRSDKSSELCVQKTLHEKRRKNLQGLEQDQCIKGILSNIWWDQKPKYNCKPVRPKFERLKLKSIIYDCIKTYKQTKSELSRIQLKRMG